MIVTPNLIWQAQHGFVSLEFLRSIHDRDVRIGRTQSYLSDQLFVGASVVTLPLWLGGLWFYLRSASGAPFRTLGWMYVVPFVVFLVSQGRGYYLAPAYPMLLAAGAVVLDDVIARRSRNMRRLATIGVGLLMAVGGLVSAALMLPIAPVGSSLWEISSKVHDNFAEQIGWEELTQITADVYFSIPETERPATAILAANYGEVGALNLYGPSRGLPAPLSGVNTSWYRGLGTPEPARLILLGYRREAALTFFEQCELAALVSFASGIKNEESRDHPEIFLCQGLRQPWPETWAALRHFG